jgi:hypothetical protein
MTFDEFKAAYLDAFKRMMSYTSDQIGSLTYAEKMAALSDAHPDWAEQIERAA